MTTRRDSTETGDSPTAVLAADPAIEPLIAEYEPLSIDPADDIFERFVVSILRQQISTAAARSIEERLFEAVTVTPEGLLAADEQTLREAGLSAQKATYVRNVAEAFLERDYDVETFREMTDEAIVSELTTIAGVGDWTAKMFLLFCLGREDVFPVEDLGIRKGMRTLFDEDLSRAAMVERAEAWRPYRSYASLYLWRHAD